MQRRTMQMKKIMTTMLLIFQKSKTMALTTVRQILLAIFVMATVMMMMTVRMTLFASSVKNTKVFPPVAEVPAMVRHEIIARTLLAS
jgi:hypothetical protein